MLLSLVGVAAHTARNSLTNYPRRLLIFFYFSASLRQFSWNMWTYGNVTFSAFAAHMSLDI